MATAYGSSNSAQMTSAAGANNLVITKPASLAVGDLMIAFIGIGRTPALGSMDTPAGWTLKADELVSNPIGAVFVKKATSGDVAAANFTFVVNANAANYGIAGALVRVTGTNGFVGADNVVIAHATDNNSGTSAKVLAAAVLPAAAGSLYIMCAMPDDYHGISNYAIVSNNPVWTEREDVGANVSNTDFGVAIATAPVGTVASSGNFSFDIPINAPAVGFLLSVSETIAKDGNHSLLTQASHIFTTGISVGTTASHTLLEMESEIFSTEALIDTEVWTDQKVDDINWTDQKL